MALFEMIQVFLVPVTNSKERNMRHPWQNMQCTEMNIWITLSVYLDCFAVSGEPSAVSTSEHKAHNEYQ